MGFQIPRPTGTTVRNLHAKLARDWDRRIRVDEEIRDIVHQRNVIETLEESDDRNMEAVEIHCIDVNTPVLTRDLRWVRAGDLEVGDKLLAFNEQSTPMPRHSLRFFEESTVTEAARLKTRGYIVTFSNGDVLRTTGEHPLLTRQASEKGASWKRVDEMYDRLFNRRGKHGPRPVFYVNKYFDTWEYDSSYDAGYTAGQFDSHVQSTGASLKRISQGLEKRMVDAFLGEFPIVELKKRFGNCEVDAYLPLPYHLAFEADGGHWHPEGGNSQRDEYLLKEFNLPVVHLSEEEIDLVLSHDKTAVRGGFSKMLEFLGSVRPKGALEWWSRFDVSTKKIIPQTEVTIKSIKKTMFKFEIAQFSTSSQTYFSAGYPSHNSGRAGGIIDHANGLLMALPGFHAEPQSLTTEDAREADQVERACAAMFQRQLIINDFWPSVGRDVLIYGRAFIKALPMTSVWTIQEGYPVRLTDDTDKTYLARIRDWKETEAKFPFIVQYIPALAVLPMLDSNDQVICTLEEKFVTAKIIADEFDSQEVKELLERRSLNWYDELPIIEYTDGEWIGYYIAGTEPRQRNDSLLPWHKGVRAYKLLRAWRHGLGKCPVVMIPGIRTEIQDYEWHFKSFLSDAKEALIAFDRLISRLATMVYAYYLPSYEWKILATSAQFAGRERPDLKVNLGGVTVTFQDETLQPLQPASPLPDAGLLLQQLDDIIQRHTLEDVLFGRVPGSAPAFQVSLRINVAKSKLTPITQHMAQGLTQALELFLRGIMQLGEAVVVGGEKVTVNMAKKYYNRVTATILPKNPVDRSQDIGSANMALQFGLPWDWIVENILDIENPSTLRLQKDIAEIENLPPVKERLMMDALDQLEALIEEEEFQDAGGIDLSQLPPEMAQAIQGLMGGGAAPGEAMPQLGADPGEGGPPGAGLGRGPFPPGAAPQTIQGGRGLNTQKTQPAPGSVEVGSEMVPPIGLG